MPVFEIDGNQGNAELGFAVAGIGDFNGDGLDDVAVGEPDRPAVAPVPDGEVYVVYGKQSSTTVSANPGAMGSAGIGIAGSGSRAGRSLAGAGDVNGDGRGDLIVGAPDASASKGAAYVIYGRAAAGAYVALGTLGSSDGYTIGPPSGTELAGDAVAGPGDLNGDGRPDVLVAGRGDALSSAGRDYAVFYPNTALPSLDPNGFTIDGASGERLGRSIAGLGDFNGDGARDLIAGVQRASVTSPARTGACNARTSGSAGRPPPSARLRSAAAGSASTGRTRSGAAATARAPHGSPWPAQATSTATGYWTPSSDSRSATTADWTPAPPTCSSATERRRSPTAGGRSTS